MRSCYPTIFVPRLLKHDDANHVLIIQDLGNHPTADVWLRTPDLPREVLTNTGSVLGSFLADFHLSTPEDIQFLSRQFENEDMSNVVFATAVEPIKAILEKFHFPDSTKIYEAVVQEYNKFQKRESNKIFSMGDLWPASILVNQSPDKVELGLIDWEFACVSPPSQDIGQFGEFLLWQLVIYSRTFTRRGSRR